MTQSQIADATAKAEIAIEKVLLDLESRTGRRLDWVTIDTRNFANCDVEIFLKEAVTR